MRALKFLAVAALAANAFAEVGDPQIRTDHPFYPGELAISTFRRLFQEEAAEYQRATGVAPVTEQDRALAAWFFRNTHYAHGEEGAEDLWGKGFRAGGDMRSREYWTGLFADGFGLCGTTHSQWTAEINELLGRGRARGVGVNGHNSFEAFIDQQWRLLDHDISTVIFDVDGKSLLSIQGINADVKRWTDRDYLPAKQHGWLICGLDRNDGGVYSAYTTAEYFPGYASAPPMVHLRRGEKLRRFFEPGLEDGKTFVFWGRNYNTAGLPGPERSQTWVNQPEKMRNSKDGTGYHPGQARFANAVYTYRPDFTNGDYREGAIAETTNSVTFEFYTPYIIGATPPNATAWGIYNDGGRNGLVLSSAAECGVDISVDQGSTWKSLGSIQGQLDATDAVKGHRQYWIRFNAGAQKLAGAKLELRTVCQAAVSVLPRLKDNGTEIAFAASKHAVISAGPNLPQAKAHIVAGAFDTPEVTLELAAPHGEPAVEIYAAAQVASGNPPASGVLYQIESSTNGGRTWSSIVHDWHIEHCGDEPNDFWSQSLCYGGAPLSLEPGKILVRFRNSGRRNYLRAEAHLVYRTESKDDTRVTFNWKDSSGDHVESHLFPSTREPAIWMLNTGQAVRTRWIELEAIRSR